MKKVGEYLKERRTERDLSLRDAAKLSGISHPHISKIEDGSRHPAFDMVMALLKAYHADAQEFLRETGYLPPNIEPVPMGKVRRIPVISWVLAGKWEDIHGTFQPADAEDWIESEINGTDLFATRVKGDSMEPEFQEDDIITVNPHLKAEHNDYVIVKNDEEEATFKQLKKYDKTRVLHPLNPKYPDIVLSDKKQYKIVGKVVEKVKRKRY